MPTLVNQLMLLYACMFRDIGKMVVITALFSFRVPLPSLSESVTEGTEAPTNGS